MSKDNYIVSVITPFHNTKKELLQKGMNSLLNQTIGFENIEWVITVHNSEKSYLADVMEMTKGYDNIKVYELHTKERTPSVPRNYCIERATGKYLAFMDSDDSYNPDALKTVAGYMDDKKAQMASFRAELEKEDSSVVSFMDLRVPFEQIEDCYVLEKGDRRRGMLLYGGSATVWSKMINRDFLNQYGIRFNKDVTIGEDGLFCLNCYKYAEKVLLLPHVIGYRYYMNHGSLAQDTVNTSHTSESIRSLADNVGDIMEAALDAKVDIDYVGWGLGGLMGISMAISPNITQEDKEYIKEKVGPFMRMLSPIEGVHKIYTARDAMNATNLVNMFILGDLPKLFDSFDMILKPILEDNKNTEIGRKYDFDTINSLKEFQERVPLTDYKFYQPIVELMTTIGESEIITKNKISTYSVTKDPYGNTCYIPQTDMMVNFCRGIFYDLLEKAEGSTFSLFDGFGKKNIINKDGSSVIDLRGAWLDDMWCLDAFNSHQKEYKHRTITSPELLVFSDSKEDLTYARLIFALADKDVKQIIAPFTEDVLGTMECLEKNWEMLVKDLFDGKISEESGLSEETREILSATLLAMPARAMEIADICKEGFTNIVPKLWPNLKLIVATGTGRYAYATKLLKKYTGEIPMDNGYLMTSEAVIAKSKGSDTDEYMIMDSFAYIEYLPDKNPENKCVTLSELEAGKIYEIVITNVAGLYRFRTDVTVEVVHQQGGYATVKYVITAD